MPFGYASQIRKSYDDCRHIAAAVLAGCLCFSIQASATETEDELRRQQRETQQQLNEINQQMKSIEGQRDEILEELLSVYIQVRIR